jgi:hypothetical protein
MTTGTTKTMFDLATNPTGLGSDLRAVTTTGGRTVVEFDSFPFEESHGQTPRGRGSWAFSFKRDPDLQRDEVLWSPSMTYGEAKKWARQQVKERCSGHVTLYAQP